MPELDAAAYRYDQVPYDSFAFPETHPDHLAALATLFGLTPPSVPGARVLEIGCAGGGNLIPMAVAMPAARFLGIDLSSRQIDEALGRSRALGLRNVEFRTMNLVELLPEGETAAERFDFLIAHGLYSWVSESVRDRLLAVIRARLAPNGVAFVSYNALPGWHLQGIVRDLLLYETAQRTEPAEQIRAARDALEATRAHLPETGSPYALFLRREVERLRQASDSTLYHDFLEPESRPVYLHEFAARSAAHGLRYLTDARQRTTADSQPPELRTVLDALGDDPVRREQRLDFLRNRTFRRTLLVHQEAGASPRILPERFSAVRVAAAAGPTSDQPDIHTEAIEPFRRLDDPQPIAVSSPLIKAALVVLVEAWPGSIPTPDLHRRVLALLDQPPAHRPAASFDRSPGALFEALRTGLALGLIDVRTFDPPLARRPGPRPAASPIAHHQAESGNRVTNLLHRVVELSDFDRLVLRQLDGRTDRAMVLDRLVASVVSGAFPLTRDGQPIRDAIEVRQILARSLDPALERLGLSALLVEPPPAAHDEESVRDE
jgi:SAM-dependent methyltransferase